MNGPVISAISVWVRAVPLPKQPPPPPRAFFYRLNIGWICPSPLQVIYPVPIFNIEGEVCKMARLENLNFEHSCPKLAIPKTHWISFIYFSDAPVYPSQPTPSENPSTPTQWLWEPECPPIICFKVPLVIEVYWHFWDILTPCYNYILSISMFYNTSTHTGSGKLGWPLYLVGCYYIRWRPPI